jgi:hypothetical protein
MILLELTEKEAEFIRNNMLSAEDLLASNESSTGRTDRENQVVLCRSIVSKVVNAFVPQKELIITFKDLFYVISSAKEQYHKLHPDLHISNKKIEENDLKHISLANALIMWLNGKNLLKRLARFDFTDESCQYEEME